MSVFSKWSSFDSIWKYSINYTGIKQVAIIARTKFMQKSALKKKTTLKAYVCYQ